MLNSEVNMKKKVLLVIAIFISITNLALTQRTVVSVDYFSSITSLLDVPEIPLATISTGFISSPICGGSIVLVPYTVSGSFNPGNVFTAQLSDASGSFTIPSNIGSIISTSSGTISSVIPGNTIQSVGYRIRVISSNPSVTGSDNGSNIIISPLPVPVINGSNTACLNSSQTFSTVSTPGHSYTWEANGGLIAGNIHQTSILVNWTTLNTSGTVTLIETNNLSGCQDSTSKVVTLNPLPTPSISGLDTACNKTIQTYNCPVTVGHTYSWSANGGSIASSNNNSANVLWNTKNSWGTVSVLETINATGCTASTSKTITINPVPSSYISGDFDVCKYSIQNYSTTFTPGVDYQWNAVGVNIIGNNNGLIVSVNWNTGLSSSTITLVVTNQTTLCKDSSVQIVNMLPLPIPSFTGPNSSFKDSSEYYTTTALNGNSFRWKVTGGSIVGPFNNVDVRVKWLSPPSGTITLIQTVDATGCQDSLNKVVTIKPFSPYFEGAQNTCENTIENYTVATISGASYTWTITDGNFLGVGNHQPSIQVQWLSAGSGTISLAITLDSTGYKDSSYKAITINQLPATPLLFGTSSSCVNKIETYSTSQIKGFTLKWSVVEGLIVSDDNQPDVQVRWLSEPSGTITLVKTVAYPYNSCSSSTFQIINVYALPAPAISGATTAVKNTSEHYSVNNNQGSKFKWSVIGGSISGSDSSSEVDILWGNGNSGILTAKETNSNNCTDSSIITVSLLANSVSDNANLPYSLKLYPNPSAGTVNLELTCNTTDYYEIEIVNVFGITVRKIYGGMIGAGTFKAVWDGADSASNPVFSGLYFVSVKNKAGNLTNKVMILR
jgi:hypothetical protein